MRIFFIFNLKAGKGTVKRNLPDMIDVMSEEGHDVTVHATRFAGDARERIVNLPEGRYDRIVCSGGDGTLDEVVAGMKQRKEKLPIGYIPGGSTNDFAASLGLPKKVRDATKAAIGNVIYNCDVGRFNDKSFVYVAAFGLFTEVSYETPQDMKNMLGHAAYIVEGFKRLQDIKSYRIKVEANGKVKEKEFIYGMITNSSSVGGFKNITGKDVDLSDGLFEVTLIEKPQNALDLNGIFTAMLNRDIKAKGFYSFKAGSIRFESEVPIPWTLDGEFGGKETNVQIINEEKSLPIAIG